jgi:hypothetical protein
MPNKDSANHGLAFALAIIGDARILNIFSIIALAPNVAILAIIGCAYEFVASSTPGCA